MRSLEFEPYSSEFGCNLCKLYSRTEARLRSDSMVLRADGWDPLKAHITSPVTLTGFSFEQSVETLRALSALRLASPFFRSSFD